MEIAAMRGASSMMRLATDRFSLVRGAKTLINASFWQNIVP